MAQQHVLVIDDDPSVTDLLSRALAYEGYSVAVANGGQTGLDLARERPPDVVVLDIMMPGVDGLEVCRRLKAEKDVPVLLLTAKDTISDKVKGLDTGADDYLVKPFALKELAARLRALLRRHQPAAPEPETLRYSDLVLDSGARTARRGSRDIQLSTTEFKLLALFMRHAGQVLTRDQIMEQVWEYDFEGDSNVIEVYVWHLRTKLEAGGEPRLIQTMRGSGYVLRA